MWQAAGMPLAHAQACLRVWFGSMCVEALLLAIGLPSSVVEMWVCHCWWHMPACAVAMLGGLPSRCSGRALRLKIAGILAGGCVPTASCSRLRAAELNRWAMLCPTLDVFATVQKI